MHCDVMCYEVDDKRDELNAGYEGGLHVCNGSREGGKSKGNIKTNRKSRSKSQCHEINLGFGWVDSLCSTIDKSLEVGFRICVLHSSFGVPHYMRCEGGLVRILHLTLAASRVKHHR